jgi:hypothetical protein
VLVDVVDSECEVVTYGYAAAAGAGAVARTTHAARTRPNSMTIRRTLAA